MTWANKKAVLSQELPLDSGHLYRKLVPKPRAMQWTEISLKISTDMEKLSKNNFRNAPVRDWRMSPHGITGSTFGPKFTRNSGNKFRLARPQRGQIFVAPRQKVFEVSLVEEFCSPEKLAKFHPRSSDLSSINRPYTSFYTHYVVTLALDCFVSEISTVLYSKCPFVHTPRLSPKIWWCSPKARSL